MKIDNEDHYLTTENAIGDLFNIKAGNQCNPIKLPTEPKHFFQKFVRGLLSPSEYIKILTKIS